MNNFLKHFGTRTDLMSRWRFSQDDNLDTEAPGKPSKLGLAHAWLSLLDKHITTGRINQGCSVY